MGVLERFEVEGRKPVGRPGKTWKRCIREDLALMGLDDNQEENSKMEKNTEEY